MSDSKTAKCPICSKLVRGQKEIVSSYSIEAGKFTLQLANNMFHLVPGGRYISNVVDHAIGSIDSNVQVFSCECGHKWKKRFE